MSGLLDELIERVQRLPKGAREGLVSDALDATKHLVWVPNPGPQTAAYFCDADELYYGGQAGGGKSDLAIGLALTAHRRSLILRRFNDDAKVLAERTMEVLGSRQGYNGQSQVLRVGDRLIEYGGCKDLEDRQRYKGDPHDLIEFDEIPDFLEAQYTFIIGWNRSADPNQRCRVLCTGNPPTTPEGLWVLKRWAAWLDPAHPKPAKESELRWYTTINGTDTEMDGPGPHDIGEKDEHGQPKLVLAKSRTFIRARLSDNPDLARTNYDAVLAGMPEELRAAYREGRFDAGLKDKPMQIIPTAWVRAAQERWTEKPPIGVPMCAMAVDCTGGGVDPMVIGWRHDAWFAPLVSIPGHEIPAEMAGRAAAGYVITYRRDGALMIVDMGGGYGGPLYEHLHDNIDQNPDRQPLVKPYKGSEATPRRTHDQQWGFANVRTMALWRMRELLDPGQAGGSPAMLPPDQELLADLTAVTYEIRRSTIHAEPKVDVCARLGRSTNKGDTVCMEWTDGPIASTDIAIWEARQREMGTGGRAGARPQVQMGRKPLTGHR